jgi:hypothetical protein
MVHMSAATFTQIETKAHLGHLKTLSEVQATTATGLDQKYDLADPTANLPTRVSYTRQIFGHPCQNTT